MSLVVALSKRNCTYSDLLRQFNWGRLGAKDSVAYNSPIITVEKRTVSHIHAPVGRATLDNTIRYLGAVREEALLVVLVC